MSTAQATKSDAEIFAERCFGQRIGFGERRETIGDRSAAAHAQSRFDLDAKYPALVGIDDALNYLEKLGHNSATATSR